MTDTDVAVETRAGGRWSRLAALGFILAALAPALFLLAGTIWGLDISEDIVFFTVPIVIGLLAAFLVTRFGTWAKIVGIVFAVLIAGALFWTAFGIAAPGSFFDFVPGILLVPGVIIAIIGCVAALRARSAPPTPREGRVIRTILTVELVLALVSGALTFLTKEDVSSSDAQAASQTVVLKDFEYAEGEYEFEAGSSVLVRNDDPFRHTFTIEDLDIDVTMDPGSEQLVDIPDGSGEYVVFCRPHTSDPDDPGEDDMYANVTIR